MTNRVFSVIRKIAASANGGAPAAPKGAPAGGKGTDAAVKDAGKQGTPAPSQMKYFRRADGSMGAGMMNTIPKGTTQVNEADYNAWKAKRKGPQPILITDATVAERKRQIEERQKNSDWRQHPETKQWYLVGESKKALRKQQGESDEQYKARVNPILRTAPDYNPHPNMSWEEYKAGRRAEAQARPQQWRNNFNRAEIGYNETQRPEYAEGDLSQVAVMYENSLVNDLYGKFNVARQDAMGRGHWEELQQLENIRKRINSGTATPLDVEWLNNYNTSRRRQDRQAKYFDRYYSKY